VAHRLIIIEARSLPTQQGNRPPNRPTPIDSIPPFGLPS
jgi:hypothetical protein